MKGTDPIRRLLRGFALAMVIAAFVTTGAAAAKPKVIQTAWGSQLPELTYGTSVAIAPDGTPWFGAEDSSGPLLASVEENQLTLDYLEGEHRVQSISTTSDLRFNSEGDLWFIKRPGAAPRRLCGAPPEGRSANSASRRATG